MFFKFLEQQGYALPSEVDSVLGVGVRTHNQNNVGGRGQSPCPSIVDQTMTISKSSNENKRVARRLRKISSSSQSNDSAMEVEQTECSRLHINYNKAQNTRNGINITMSSIDDFRKLNSYLIKSDIPFHTYALEEERKVKAVLKGVPVEIDTEDIKADLVRQEYPVQAVHRMHRRDGTALGLVLAILNKTDGATDIFKKLANVCGLSGITVEAPYKKEGKPACCNCGSDHTANYGGCPAAPKPKPKSSYNKNSTKVHQTSRPLDVSHFPALNSGNKQTARTVPTKPTGSKNFHPAPAPKENQWKNPLPWVNPKTTGTENRVPQKQPTRQTGTAASALGEDIGTIMSILQVVRSAEVADLAAKFRKAKHGVDRLKIILENQELINRQGAPKGGTALYYRQTLNCSPIDIPPLINLEATGCRLTMSSHGAIIIISVYLPPKKELLRSDVETLFALGDAVILFGDLNSKSTQWRCNYTNANGRKMIDLAKDLHFDVIAPPTQTYFPNNVRNRPDILDIALMRRVALNVRCIETLQNLNSDHRPVLLKIGPPDGEQPPKNKTITSWRKVSLLLEETDTPILNNIPDNIETTDEIDYAIGALTNHIATVIEDSSRRSRRPTVAENYPKTFAYF
ncbi:RNA-directed DNA polymerase from mobile element jockey [Eumeta japonica]|uniref:RNA-directed DNA polymerase from mobile element jockey n=1 Tax=Eumeta variegata TaxID=151549 RepID=A0A4C1Y483_EUMVA|nr:RNA-directed DNA polymerase from mobile element jockey [Eumeta japonica]